MISSALALAPLGTTEMLIIAVLLGIMALVVGGIILLVVHLSKKQK